MKVTFSLDGKKTQISIKTGNTVNDVLKKHKVNQGTGLIKLNGKLAHPATKLKDGDELEFVNIIYGG